MLFSSLTLINVTAQAASLVSIEIADRSIRVYDVVENGGIYSNEILSTLPRNSKSVTLSLEDRLLILRKKFPTHNFSLRHRENVAFSVTPKVVLKTPKYDCFKAKSQIIAGTVIILDLVQNTDCQADKTVSSIKFDREARITVAYETLDAGAYLGRLYLHDKETIQKGSNLTFITEDGPVIIQRKVTALQSSQIGKKIFVKTNDGKIISSVLFNAAKGNINEKTNSN